jgi:3-phenylpropionate/trans-cinnamate dioxygenase ferredoxin component
MVKIKAGKILEITPNKMVKMIADEKEIMIININGNFYAMDDTCTHSGSSLSEGKLDGDKVICGWHSAEFDCKTGKLVKFPAKIRDLKSYNVIIDQDNVFVEM